MDEQNKTTGNAEMAINETKKQSLLNAARWAKVMAIVACINIPMLLILGFKLLLIGIKLDESGLDDEITSYIILVGLVLIALAVIMIYPIYKGFQFAGGTKAAFNTNNEGELTRGLKGLSSLFTFYGVFSIIGLVASAISFFKLLPLLEKVQEVLY